MLKKELKEVKEGNQVLNDQNLEFYSTNNSLRDEIIRLKENIGVYEKSYNHFSREIFRNIYYYDKKLEIDKQYVMDNPFNIEVAIACQQAERVVHVLAEIIEECELENDYARYKEGREVDDKD